MVWAILLAEFVRLAHPWYSVD